MYVSTFNRLFLFCSKPIPREILSMDRIPIQIMWSSRIKHETFGTIKEHFLVRLRLWTPTMCEEGSGTAGVGGQRSLLPPRLVCCYGRSLLQHSYFVSSIFLYLLLSSLFSLYQTCTGVSLLSGHKRVSVLITFLKKVLQYNSSNVFWLYSTPLSSTTSADYIHTSEHNSAMS